MAGILSTFALSRYGGQAAFGRLRSASFGAPGAWISPILLFPIVPTFVLLASVAKPVVVIWLP